MLPRSLLLIGCLVTLTLLLLACGGGADEDGDSTPETPPPDAGAIRDIDLAAVAEVQTALRQLGSAALDLADVTYADLTGDRREEAIVPVSSQGTLGNIAYVVLTLRAGAPASILTRTMDRTSAGGLSVDVSEGKLVETAAEYGAEDPFCCPSTLRKTYFRWDGSRLQVEREERVAQPRGPKS